MKALFEKKAVTVSLSVVFWITLWWVVAAVFGMPLLLPTPWATLKCLVGLAATKAFWLTVAGSLLRIVAGIVLALVSGSLLAVLTVKSKLCHTLFSPMLTLFKATPVASVIFLLLLWVGRGRVPLVIAFMMALPIVWGNVREGLLATDKGLLEMAAVFEFSAFKKWRYIHLPSILPYFLAACRSAMGLAWKAGVAAEVLCTPKGSIGRAIYESQLYFYTNELFAWTLLVILLSLLIEEGALRLLGRVDKHRGKEVTRDAED